MSNFIDFRIARLRAKSQRSIGGDLIAAILIVFFANDLANELIGTHSFLS